MKAKEYLSEALEQDRRVTRKIEQIERLQAMADKATSTISNMPKAPGRNVSSREMLLVKLIDLKHEVNQQIDDLIDMKRERGEYIDKIGKPEYQDVLEFRYLLAMKWEKIAERMNVSERYVYILHGRALQELDEILRKNELVQ